MLHAGEDSREVVGVSGDVANLNDLLGSQSAGMLYVPFAQGPQPYAVDLVLHGPAAIGEEARGAIQALDGLQVIEDVTTLDDVLREEFGPQRLLTWLLGVLGFLAIVLASIGIFGLVAYAVSQRTREIGIRMAIGGTAGAVVALLVRQAMRPIAIGLCLELASALVLLRGLQSFFFLPTTGMAIPLGVVLAFLGGVTACAALLPARRAAKVDPMIVL